MCATTLLEFSSFSSFFLSAAFFLNNNNKVSVCCQQTRNVEKKHIISGFDRMVCFVAPLDTQSLSLCQRIHSKQKNDFKSISTQTHSHSHTHALGERMCVCVHLWRISVCGNSIGTKINIQSHAHSNRGKEFRFFRVRFVTQGISQFFFLIRCLFEFAVTATLHFHTVSLSLHLLPFAIVFNLIFKLCFCFLFPPTFSSLARKTKFETDFSAYFHRSADRFNCHIKYVIKAIKCERNHMCETVCVRVRVLRIYGIR